jgi:hypothetical protein
MTDDNYSPDRLPEVGKNLIHVMDGLVQDYTMLYGLPELEASFLVIKESIEGLTTSFVETWQIQGKGDSISVRMAVIDGLLDTIQWLNIKADSLIDSSKLQ